MHTSGQRRTLEDDQHGGPVLLHDRRTAVPKGRRSRLRWILAVVLILLVVAVIGFAVAAHYAEPLLKARIIETLSTRFHSRVELSAFHVSLHRGLQVSGEGLKIYAATDLNIHRPGVQPLIAVDEFRFGAGIINLFRTPMRVRRVFLKGLQINVPASGQRGQVSHFKPGKMKVYVDEFICEQAELVINTLNPKKLPLEFDIRKLNMQEIGPGQPLHFNTTLVNAKPVGDIQSSGYLGPWDADDPKTTPIRGDYSFTDADLSTIHGIGGILSSTGHYNGTLQNIVIDGQTNTPDFRISISGHPVPLSTTFHAIVDATSGDTYLQPVKAKILHSSLIAKGSVVREQLPHGHRITLDVVVDPARIEDLLELGVRTNPPVMTGTAQLKTKFDLRPGEADITDRLHLAGTFEISRAHFSNEKIQSKLDSLSMRGLGKPDLAKKKDVPDVPSLMSGQYTLASGVLSFSQLHFQMPGTQVDLTGRYSLDGNQFDFHGTARMQAKLSHMVGGWKSILLKPVDPFFSKHGAGTEVPVKVTGTRSEPHFGLDFGHKERSK